MTPHGALDFSQQWFHWRLVACVAPSHYPHQYQIAVSLTTRKEFQLKCNQRWNVFIEQNACVNKRNIICVSGLATDSPCGVWGRGWATCLLHDSPLFGSWFKMGVGMQVWSEISYIHYYLLPRFTVSCIKLVGFFTLWWPFHIPSTLCAHKP